MIYVLLFASYVPLLALCAPFRILSPILLPHIIGNAPGPGDWALPLLVAGGLYLAGACCCLFVNLEKPVLEGQERFREGEVPAEPG